ncbi:hypothetical protein ACFOY8_14540 [Thalassospira xianhensis]|uniref:Uncharacterized protein n=1 Tax=Thalassospira xianhensis MCCC 1A02616 TaxID=1177929 RepID=A0A367UHI8_9PROT|nr:hypothetical protein [Thalassospira xianhensis]RCK07629.1 hypothetical protein TH5_00705 [Thalassospira xianhensis MCCC 1A02616]
MLQVKSKAPQGKQEEIIKQFFRAKSAVRWCGFVLFSVAAICSLFVSTPYQLLSHTQVVCIATIATCLLLAAHHKDKV